MTVRVARKEVVNPVLGIVSGRTIGVRSSRCEPFVPNGDIFANDRHDHVRGSGLGLLTDAEIGSVGEPEDLTSALIHDEGQTQTFCIEGTRAFDVGHLQECDVGVNLHVPIVEYLSANL